MPGGGLSAALYAHGIFLALFKAGLLERNGVFNTDNIFIGTSGATIPIMLVLFCFHLELNKKYPDIWFDKFVTKIIEKIDVISLIKLYGVSQVQSFLDESMINCYVNNLVTYIASLEIESLLPPEFFGQMGVDFKTSEYSHYFKFNYIRILDNYLPTMTDTNDDLVGLNIIDQIKQIFMSCCTINGWSAERPWQNHDAGLMLQNYVNCISNYLKIPSLKYVMYFGLESYSTNSLKSSLFRNTLDFGSRSNIEINYFQISYLKSLCIKSNKIFELVAFPNKYNNSFKFNVPIYNKLSNIIDWETDFDSLQRFSGSFGIFHDNVRMYKLVSLFGYYECLHAVKRHNADNIDKLGQFKTVDYAFIKQLKYDEARNDVTVDKTNANLFHLQSFDGLDKIVDICAILKFKRFCDKTTYLEKCNVANVDILAMYIRCMQTAINIVPDSEYYLKCVPIDVGTNPDIFEHPENYLSEEYKYVSDHCLDIYYPLFATILHKK
jgi:hypothetical protein